MTLIGCTTISNKQFLISLVVVRVVIVIKCVSYDNGLNDKLVDFVVPHLLVISMQRVFLRLVSAVSLYLFFVCFRAS